MKKLISFLAVVLVLVFSCVLTSFADDSVVSGYAVDNVPYNELFDGVLTSSDSGSQLYSASENRTYKTSSVLSAPATSSNSVYHFKSITDFIPWNIWRGSNSPVITNPQKDGYTGVKYVWESNPPAQNFYHFNSMQAFSKLRPTRKYRISFTFNLSRTNGTFQFYLADQSTPDVAILYLLKASGYNGNAGYIASTNAKYTIEFTMPNDNVKIVPVVKGTLAPTGSTYSGVETEFYINDFTIIDITTEDLDNSLNKLGDRLENSINPSVPYNEFDDGSFKDSADELKEAENALPTVDFNAIDELASSVDVSSYAQAFSGINQLFIRVVDTIGITPLIFFACFFGFCIFLIGRKLSGG